MRFDEFNLNEKILEAVSFMGFREATAIQEKVIPELMKGRDIIACAQTGTGKTAAFVLPILHGMAEHPPDGVNTLIIVPTRELAVQIEQQIQGLSYFLPVSSVAIYGGGDGMEWGTQKAALSGGANIVVATPGKLISHLNMGNVDFSKVRHFVLDEADRMLDMNFFDDIIKIAGYLTNLKHTSMFSATMSPRIRKLAQELLKDPAEITVAIAKPSEKVRQLCYYVSEDRKTGLVAALIRERPHYNRILVFTSTKRKVSSITQGLKRAGFAVEAISSDFDQKEREAVVLRFRSDRTRVLVATDVLSRGIDIKDINLIVNYDVPHEPEDYVHRIGRTARAETEGEAITFITGLETKKFERIEHLIGYKVQVGPMPEGMPADSPRQGGDERRGRPQHDRGRRRHGSGQGRRH